MCWCIARKIIACFSCVLVVVVVSGTLLYFSVTQAPRAALLATPMINR